MDEGIYSSFDGFMIRSEAQFADGYQTQLMRPANNLSGPLRRDWVMNQEHLDAVLGKRLQLLHGFRFRKLARFSVFVARGADARKFINSRAWLSV